MLETSHQRYCSSNDCILEANAEGAKPEVPKSQPQIEPPPVVNNGNTKDNDSTKQELYHTRKVKRFKLNSVWYTNYVLS